VAPRSTSPYIGHLGGITDPSSFVSDVRGSGFKEIKVWQAVMDYISSIPVKNENGITVLKKDSVSTELRGIHTTEK
jgi:5'-nucleotidase